MSELMLVNPRRKRRKSGGKRRRKMSALQLQYFGKRRSRRSAPVRRRRRRRSASLAAVAPVRRSRRHRRHRRVRVSRYRRNPMKLGSFSVKRFMNDTLIPGGIGAMGALGVDIGLAYANPMLPASLQSGIANTAVKLAGAVVVGMAAGMVAGKRFGEQATAGAVTVTLYDLIKGYVKSAMPSLPLSMGWVSPGYQVGYYDNPNLSAYVGGDRAYSGMSAYVGETESDYYH